MAVMEIGTARSELLAGFWEEGTLSLLLLICARKYCQKKLGAELGLTRRCFRFTAGSSRRARLVKIADQHGVASYFAMSDEQPLPVR